MKTPFKVNLKDKVAAVTGGGGILCGCMAEALAACGARVAVLDLRKDAADKVAAGIRDKGGQAEGFACNVLERESLQTCCAEVASSLGKVDILINGAGGNHPKGTTTREQLKVEDLARKEPGFVSFFDLDPAGIQFVFNLNFLGTLLPTQVFTKAMAEKQHGVVINISSMNSFKPLTKIPAYS
ncbi:MAG: SDR family NAD(P)-dependent oxidoreductase, partial [Kiritimatiellae bacterium]|nr:SDR family NAD(P)-dependent oxidoreductase [Kiritimatiellia bacterium]